MRLNEKIGYTSFVIGLMALYGTLFVDTIFVFLQILCFFVSTIFLSYWGLTTFNDKFEK